MGGIIAQRYNFTEVFIKYDPKLNISTKITYLDVCMDIHLSFSLISKENKYNHLFLLNVVNPYKL